VPPTVNLSASVIVNVLPAETVALPLISIPPLPVRILPEDPDWSIVPFAVNVGSVSPVVVTIPLIAGAVNILFANVWVAFSPTSVSDEEGKVIVVASVPANVRELSRVSIFTVVPPLILKPEAFELNDSPLIEPKLVIVGEPEPLIVPFAVKEGRVSPVVVMVPLIAGAVNVLFVNVSGVVLPINVSVTSGSVSTLAAVGDQFSVPFVPKSN